MECWIIVIVGLGQKNINPDTLRAGRFEITTWCSRRIGERKKKADHWL